MKLISPKITEAIKFALIAHEGQKRNDNRPFIVHPLSVAFILQSAGYREEVVIAGILHDVVEDTKFTEQDIKEQFGEEIAALVMGVTEDKTIKDWSVRKQGYLDHLKTASAEVKALSAADLLDNRRSIFSNLENNNAAIWSTFSASPEAILRNSEERLAIIQTEVNNEITKELEVVMEKIKRSILA